MLGLWWFSLMWILLGSVLNPTSLLPYSAAVIGFVAISIKYEKKLSKMQVLTVSLFNTLFTVSLSNTL